MNINASELKAKCSSILDRVFETGEEVTILKRGKPVARLVPPAPSEDESPQEELRGTVIFKGDILEPAIPPEAWNAVQGKLA
ncbi:MAG: type II toxin-antitoxin system prevent-host-death family antitoxin [Acidobacteria bacterium]|nr:type II toxin-antitoxin system prevent-host-death family antitoxin [Acidobacteriota bacterium]